MKWDNDDEDHYLYYQHLLKTEEFWYKVSGHYWLSIDRYIDIIFKLYLKNPRL